MSRNKHFIALVIVLLLGLFAVTVFAQDDSGANEDFNSLRTSGGTYEIKAGDTLDVLGQTWDISVDALKLANDINGWVILRPGDVITIPPNSPPYGTFPRVDANAVGGGQGGGGGVSGETYIIQPRDTLDVIGQRLDVSVQAIIDANGIEIPARLMPGTPIIIPDDAPPYGFAPPRVGTDYSALGQGGGGGGGETHVVQRNETLDTIAAYYNLKTECLAEVNAMQNSHWLYVGDVLLIDRSCPAYDGFDFPGNG